MFARLFARKQEKEKLIELDTKRVREWSLKEVKLWLSLHELDEYKTSFEKNSIDGLTLLDLNEYDLSKLSVKKVGHVKKLLKLIEDLHPRTDDSDHSPPLSESGIMVARGELAASTLPMNWQVHDEVRELSMFMEDFVDAVCIIGTDKLIQFVNKSLEQMFGYNREDIIGCNVKVLIPEPYHSQHDSYVDNYLSTGVAKILMKQRTGSLVQGRTKDGLIFPITLAVNENVLKNGEKIFLGTIRDLRMVQPKSSSKIGAISSVLENLVTCCVVISKDCNIQFFNKSAEQLFGYSREEVISKNVALLMTEKHAPVHDSYVQRYVQTKSARVIGKGREVEAKKKDGTVFRIWLSLAETKWGESNNTSFVATIYELNAGSTTSQLEPQTKKSMVQSKGSHSNISFEELLDNPKALPFIRAFMQSSHTLELLDFILDVETYCTTKYTASRYKLAHQIKATYIQYNASQEINLPSSIRSKLLEEFVRQGYQNGLSVANCPRDLFNEAYDNVICTLVTDIGPRFFESQEYQKYLQQA